MAFKTKIGCPVCGKAAVLSKDSITLFHGVLTVKDNPFYKCTECSEKFAIGEMVDGIVENAKKQFRFTRKIVSTGGSLAITLPSDLSEFYKLHKSGKVELIPESENEIKIVVGRK